MSNSMSRRNIERRRPTSRPGSRGGIRPRVESVEARILLATFAVPSSYATITAAVTAANASPDPSNIVLVSPGTYHESNITITSPLTLESTSGAASTTIDGGNATTTQAGILRVLNTTGNVSIGGSGSNQGFTLQNPPTRQADGYVNIIDAEAVRAPLTIQNNVLIGRNGVGNPFDVGVLVQNSQTGGTALVQNNTFQAMWQGMLLELPVGGSSISNNLFDNLKPSTSGASIYEPEGVYALTYGGRNVSGLSINGNTFQNFNGLAISVDGGYPGQTPGQFSNVQIQNNLISSIGFAASTFRAGITLINDADTAAQESLGGVINSTIANNTIQGQTGCASGSIGVWVLGANNNLTVVNNLIQNVDRGLLIAEQVPGAGYASGVVAHQNAFTGNNIGILNPSSNPIDASYNYWGATDSISVKAQANGGVNVNYNPWLGNGTDTSAAPGFQPILTPTITDTVQISGNDSALAGSPYQLNLSQVTPNSNIGIISSYQINWGDGSPIQSVTGSSATANHTYNPATQTTFTISATATNTASQTFQVANTIGVTVTLVPTLVVTTFDPTPSGFHVRFNGPINTGVLNVYNGVNAIPGATNTGPPDVTLNGPSGIVYGSLKLDPDAVDSIGNITSSNGFTFVRTGLPLAPGSYTATLVGATGAVQNASTGQPLDGSRTGTPGGNFTMNFSVPATSGPTVSIPDFARGPGQPVVVPAATGIGLPIRISDGTGVTSVMVVLTYDPRLLTVSGATLASGLPAGTQIVTNSTVPGRLAICVTSPTALSAGAQDLVELNASVPTNAPYLAKAALQVQVVSINGSTSLGSGDQSIGTVAFLGDSSGNGSYNSNDTTAIRQVIVSADPFAGFGGFPLVDPQIIGNISASGALNSNDASILRHYLTSGDFIPQIPAYTGPPSSTATGPDPELFISKTLAGMPGDSVSVPVQFLQTDSASIGLQSFRLVIAFDPSSLTVSGVRPGSLAEGFQISEDVDAVHGLVVITGTRAQPLTLTSGTLGDLILLDFSVLAGAQTGSYAINLLGNSGRSVTSLNGGGLTLVPAPTNAGDDAVDGIFAIGGRRNQPPFRPGTPLAVAFATSSKSLSRSSQAIAHDLAIQSIARDRIDPSVAFEGIIPLEIGGSTADPSHSHPASANRSAPSGPRVVFWQHALSRVVATPDSSK